MKKIALLLLLVPFYAGVTGAFDFGVLLDQTLSASGIAGDDAAVDYSASLIPWLSTPIGDSGDLFVSAGLTGSYENKKGFFVPELLRTEFSWCFSNAFRLRAGRLAYADPLNFVVSGLLDGAQLFYSTEVGTFNAGVMYSGLLYKKTTQITMNFGDYISYYSTLDYGNFADTYFASRRMLMTIGWEHPALMELVRLRSSFTGQFDVNARGPDTAYHSQYLTVKAGIPLQQVSLELGGALETMQDMEQEGVHKVGVALAGEFGVSWTPPTVFQSQLSFTGRFGSGRTETGSVAAFVPVTTMEQGYVLKAKLSGLSALNLDYTARFRQALSASLDLTYFLRHDLGTYMGYPASVADEKSYLLGGELFGRVIWSPVSDLRLNAGGGVFLPAMGNVAPDAKPLWRIELNLILALY
jgi:hypothetical protein